MKDWEPFKARFLAYATNKKCFDVLTDKLVMPKVKCNANAGDAIVFNDEEKNAFELGTKAHNDLLLSMNQSKSSTGNATFAIVNSFKNQRDKSECPNGDPKGAWDALNRTHSLAGHKSDLSQAWEKFKMH